MNKYVAVSVLGAAALVGGTALAVTELHRRPALLMGDSTSAVTEQAAAWSDEAKEEPASVYPSPPSAIGGGPPATAEEPAVAEAESPESNPRPAPAMSSNATSGSASSSASALSSATPPASSASASAVPAPTIALAAPVYGAPPPTTPSGVPAVGGGTPGDTPLYMGASGGSPNPAIVNAKPTITARVLVPMTDASSAEATWSTLTPFLRSGDLLVASAHGAGEQALSWSDRVRADTPLVAYAVAFDSPQSLEASLAKLPDGLEIVGLSQTSGIDDKKLTDLSSKVHATGRRFFVSTNLSGPSLSVLGSRADVIEIASGDAAAAKAATTAMQTTGHPQIFVRVPGATPGRALETANASSAILKSMPDAGIALPLGDQVGRVLSDLRAPP
jgi:hypothetical protein